MEKCSFAKPEIKFLGCVVSRADRRPDPEKIKAIAEMPAPKDPKQLKSFLGMISYYSSFVPEMRSMRGPLDDLEREDKFVWTAEHQKVLEKIKKMLQSGLLLMHFDPGLDIVIAADTCDYGVGAVISHRFPNGTEKAIAHASRSLTKAEKNYGQIEKEALALVFGVRKFHRYIYGRRFLLLTDHKPLLSIFGSKVGISAHSANRLQSWELVCLRMTLLPSTGALPTLAKLMPCPVSSLQRNCLRMKTLSSLRLKKMSGHSKAMSSDTCQSQKRIFGGWPNKILS